MKHFTIILAALFAASPQSILSADTDLSKLAVANNTFAFKLVREISSEQPDKNIFISPYSAATALQMAASGAGGQTKIEMQKVLETAGLSADALNAASKSVAYDLAHPKTRLQRILQWSQLSEAEFETRSNELVRLNPDLLKPEATNIVVTANALFYRQGSAIKPGFVEANQKFFSSAAKALDFNHPAAAAAEINQWASDQTQGRITGIADGMIDPSLTDLILVNAIYFKGEWEIPFDQKLTRERRFHPANHAAKNVPMMDVSAKFAYRKCDDCQAVSLPYKDSSLAMLVLLPAPSSSPAKLLAAMKGGNWPGELFAGATVPKGHLVLPKFKLENTFKLIDPLKALGMTTAFNPVKADFSGMFDDQQHCITKVRQKTFLEVGEAGTEAAAATAVERGTYGAPEKPPEPFELIVDRPFMFAIVDWNCGMILFLGVVNDL